MSEARRRDIDRLDTIARAFRTIFDAHDAQVKEAREEAERAYLKQNQMLDRLIELTSTEGVRAAITSELRARLRPFVDLDEDTEEPPTP